MLYPKHLFILAIQTRNFYLIGALMELPNLKEVIYLGLKQMIHHFLEYNPYEEILHPDPSKQIKS